MSATSPAERITAGVASWLLANLGTYLTRANLTKTYAAPALKKVAVAAWIPSEGPFPYVMVNADQIRFDPSGNGCEKYTLELSVAAMVADQKADAMRQALYRYMDALADAVRENPTMGGIADYIRVESIDKGEIPADARGWLSATLIATGEVAG